MKVLKYRSSNDKYPVLGSFGSVFIFSMYKESTIDNKMCELITYFNKGGGSMNQLHTMNGDE